MNPDVILEDEDEDGNVVEYTPKPTAVQKYLYPLYLQDIASVVELAHGDDIVLLHTAEQCAGDKYPTGLVSTRKSDQIAIAIANLAPWCALPNLICMRFVPGTDAHEFGEGIATLLIAQGIKKAHPEIDTQVVTHGNMHLRGVDIDYAHHGPYPGSREWLRGNVARLYLLDMMMGQILCGGKPPDLVLRSHYHTPIHEYLDRYDHESHLFVSPSFTFLNEHAVQATKSEYRVINGMWTFELIDGKIAGWHKFMATKDIRTSEVIE